MLYYVVNSRIDCVFLDKNDFCDFSKQLLRIPVHIVLLSESTFTLRPQSFYDFDLKRQLV